MNTKSYYIKLFRESGFNCFPIPRYPNTEEKQKGADNRYKGERTEPNQTITDDDNYGIIPIANSGTCIIDLDHKELYRKFAEENIKNNFTPFLYLFICDCKWRCYSNSTFID